MLYYICDFVCSVSWLFLLGCQYQCKWLERLVSEMTYNVLMGTLNPTHSLTHFCQMEKLLSYSITDRR